MALQSDNLGPLSEAIILMNSDRQIEYLNLKAKLILQAEEEHLSEIDFVTRLVQTQEIDEQGHHQLLDAIEKVYDLNADVAIAIRGKRHLDIVFNVIKEEGRVLVEVNNQLEHLIFDAYIDKSSDMIFYKDTELVYRYVNDAYADFFELQKTDLLGISDKELVDKNLMPPISFYQCESSDLETFKQGKSVNVEFFPNQKYYRVWKEKVGEGLLGVVRDVTEEIHVSKEREIDPVTSLDNRQALMRVLKSLPKDKDYHVVAILLENFGQVIKDEGVLFGNRCLRQIALYVKAHQNILFFHIEGIGFIGLCDRLIKDPDALCQRFESDITRLQLPDVLKTTVVMKKINLQSEILTALLSEC